MKLKAIGYNLTTGEKEIIRSMAKVLTSTPVEIVDVQSFVAGEEIDPDDILLVYGQRSLREVGSIGCRARLEFPELYKLEKTQDECHFDERQEAFDKLLKFKKMLDSDQQEDLDLADDTEDQQTTKISEESLPNLTADQVQTLEANLRKQGQTAWTGTTNDGRTIRLTVQPEESTADVDMTFAELYCIRGLMEAFRVKELEIVYKPTAASRKSNTQ